LDLLVRFRGVFVIFVKSDFLITPSPLVIRLDIITHEIKAYR